LAQLANLPIQILEMLGHLLAKTTIHTMPSHRGPIQITIVFRMVQIQAQILEFMTIALEAAQHQPQVAGTATTRHLIAQALEGQALEEVALEAVVQVALLQEAAVVAVHLLAEAVEVALEVQDKVKIK
jgi:hypothetical protein